MIEISLDQLSKYSELPELIINNSNIKTKFKTTYQVLREFEIEKWGEINQKNNNKIIDINTVENQYQNLNDEYVFFYNGKFYLAKHTNVLNKHILFYENILSKYSKDASAIVEFGAGFGSKILRLNSKNFTKDKPLFAGELTESGQQLIKKIARNMNINIQVGFIDLRERKIERNFKIPKKSLIFTSYAAHYDPNMNENFVDFLAQFEPIAVVNFEPCYELYSKNNIHGLMCKKYIEINDYTKNISSTIEKFCSKKNLNYKITKNVIGFNPLMPISALEWGF